MSVEDADDLAGFFDTDEFALAATYRVGGAGAGVTVPVLPSRGDQAVSIFGTETVSAAATYLMPAGHVAAPKSGDTLQIGGSTYVVQGVPRLDDARAIWRLEARPQ